MLTVTNKYIGLARTVYLRRIDRVYEMLNSRQNNRIHNEHMYGCGQPYKFTSLSVNVGRVVSAACVEMFLSSGVQHKLGFISSCPQKCSTIKDVSHRALYYPPHNNRKNTQAVQSHPLHNLIRAHMCRIGQNHVYTVYIRYFWLGNHQIYGVYIRIFTVLANPTYVLSAPQHKNHTDET